MSEQPELLEDIAASLLNGVMIFLLGSAFPAIFFWQSIRHWDSWTAGLNTDTLADAGGVSALGVFSFLFLRTGVRMIRRGLTALRARRRSPAAS